MDKNKITISMLEEYNREINWHIAKCHKVIEGQNKRLLKLEIKRQDAIKMYKENSNG